MDLIEVAAGVCGFPVRSPTLPPATHTNVWILGHDRLSVVDPASPWIEEQQALVAVLSRLGRPVEQILLTHHHGDHVGGAVALSEALQVPILAHPLTAERLEFEVEPLLDDVLDCGGLHVDVHHTPGHAPGHLAFETEPGALVAGDLVAGVGTIAIDTDDAGHLGTYLDSLRAMRELDARWLLPAHGPVLNDPHALLTHYLDHRRSRTEQILAALSEDCTTPLQLASVVYSDLDPRFHPLAAVQVRAHLIWLQERAAVSLRGGLWRREAGSAPALD